MKLEKTSRIAVLIALSLVWWVSCKGTDTTADRSGAPTDSSQKSIVVRIGTMGDAVDYSPYMIAQAKGWFEEAFAPHGASSVEYTSFQALAALNEAIGAGRVDIIFEAEPPAIIGRAVGNDLRVTGISCSLTQEILVRSDSQIQETPDLRGGRLTVPAGTSSHYNVLAILGEAGVSDADLEIIDMNPPDARVAFETGAVDAWAIWPPWVEQQIVAGTGRVLSNATAQIHSLMSLRGPFEDANPEIAEAALDVLERAKEWIRANPEEAQQIVADSLKLDIEVIRLAWPKHDWSAELDHGVVSDIQDKATFLYENKLIRNALDVANDLIYGEQEDEEVELKEAA